ncbi:hypothetical protein [Salinibacterium sp. M195]|uniref:hypothetical protein n=1 Tax=Salinibacterium sp. M195 TaxID=2583374 RepID=UPI001C629928|nr:hypothetical protein [Salinibacterium sp. M195]QYH35569.1 hypothetical protein FFT87_06160 [Salinibacterium sp. M195]
MAENTPAQTSGENAPPAKTSVVKNRIRQLTTPWWRLVWLIGGVVWAVVFNVLYVTGDGTQEWLGVVSVIPIAALLLDLLRIERMDRAAAQKKRQDALKK